MGNSHGATSAVSRRGFLKTTGALGAIALAGGTITSSALLSPNEANAVAEEKVAYTYHQSHCGGSCALKCTTREGKLCLIEPNPAAAEGFQTVCVKGLAEVQHIYGDSRIKTPMKCIGEKGSGQYESISWDEAMQIFGDNIKAVREKYGTGAVMAGSCAESECMLEQLSILQASMCGMGIDMGMSNGLVPFNGTMLGGIYNSAADWVNTNTLFVIGTNFVESGLVHAKWLFDAQEQGLKTICIDPHFCTTAAKCDEWIPIEPGTDGALYLGMATAILDNEWYDREFILAHTSMPFLVSEADGSLLRGEIPPEMLANPQINEWGLPVDPVAPFMVWDEASGQASEADSAIAPALEGTFEINGQKYTTVFTKLKETQQQYPLDWASSTCGIPAETIERLARIYATEGPNMIGYGYGGIDKYGCSDTVAHALATIVALSGNIGKPGTGVSVIDDGGWQAPALPSWPMDPSLMFSMASITQFEMPYADGGIHAFVSIGDKLQQYFADLNKAIEWVCSLDFFVYADVYWGTGANYADLVLPICSRFESEEEVGGLRAAKNHLMLREKIIEPLWDSKTDYALVYEMAKALGVEESLPTTIEERLNWMLSNPIDPRLEGVTLDSLKDNNGIFIMPGYDQPFVLNEDQVYSTPSTRLEVYFENMLPFGQALANYEAPQETHRSPELKTKYPLQLATLRTRFHIHNQFCDAPWIQQYLQARVELNPLDMASRGLANGDEVEVFNDRGSFGCPAFGNEAIRPGTVKVIEGEWSQFMTSGNVQNVTNPTVEERAHSLPNGPVIPFNDTLVEVKKA